jgi:hypothetical protein
MPGQRRPGGGARGKEEGRKEITMEELVGEVLRYWTFWLPIEINRKGS